MKRFYAFRFVRAISNFYTLHMGILTMVIALFGMLKPENTYATHAAGADISYQWISGNTYQVTCTFFRDCGGVAAPNTVTLRVRSATLGSNFTQTLQRLNPTGQEITFSCTGITNCGGGSQTGIQRYVYRGNVTLPGLAADWNFSYQVCCRNCSITTIVLPSPCNSSITEPQLYVEATLNNIIAPQNSSPTFTVNPIAFICQGQLFNFNQGAVDANGDSLSYELITPKTSINGTVTYIPPYNTTNFIASTPAATLSSTTGQLAMTPTILGQVGILALLVKEYRNGVLIGSTIRDIQIQIVNCSNQNPVISGVNGTSAYEIEVCAGDVVNFQVFASDPDVGQLLTLTWNSGIGAPATFTSSGVSNPTTGTFNWPTTLANGSTTPYTFVATVQDNGCFYNNVASFAFTVWVRHVTATISKVDVSCFGGNDGSATVNTGGTGPFTYAWSNGATTQTVNNLSQGTYTVTVTGTLGCSTTASVQINQPDILDLIGVVDSDVSCFGGNNGAASALASGGTSPYTYAWSNGSTTASVTGLSQGSYLVTVTDANSCTASVSVNINESTELIINISSNQPAGCLGESTGAIDITVSGGVLPYTYSWSNGATTEDINLLPAGTYSVTVTDDLGCTVTQSATVIQPSIPVPLISSTTINGVNVTCFGAASGEATVSVSGGTAPYNYLWSNGSTESSVTGLTAGIISVTVSDLNGCSNTGSYEITQPPLPFVVDIDSISNYNGANVSCDGNNDGAIYTAISGGTAPFTYAWSNAETVSSITGLAPGSYSVTVTDFYGCTASNSATINPLDPLTVSVLPTDTDGFNINCNGEASGGILTAVAGGTGPYFYLWNTGSTTATISDLTAGIYSVTLTDVNGCSATSSVTLTQPDTLVPLINVPIVSGGSNLLCFGDATASASVSVTGGIPPYTYIWSNGATDDNVSNLAAGVISVSIQDQNGCNADGSFTVTQPAQLTVSLAPNPPLNCGGVDDAGINNTVSGGTGAYTFAWSNGSTTQNLSGLGEGTYTVTVTDENNCTAEGVITFVAPIALSASSNVTTPTCNGTSDASIIVTVADGTPDYTFLWSNGSTDDNISGIGAGTYSVTITDGLGCSLVLSIPVNQPDVLTSSPLVTNVSCFGVFDGELDANPSGGTSPYTFIWSNGSTDQVNIALVADTYSVTVTDVNNCTATATATVTQPTPVVVTFTVDPQNSCLGDADGAIDLTVSGGTAPYSYLWFNESTNQDIDSLLPGIYFVTVTDANNCAVILDSIEVTQTDSLFISPNVTQPNCSVSYDGQISVAVSGGTAPFTYSWSNGSTDAILVASAGTYSVTVTDAGGCTASAGGLTIIECCNINLTAIPFSPGCGTQLGSIDLDPAGAVAPVIYTWSNGASTEDIDNLVTATYSVTVEDANGCTATGSWSINAGGANITVDETVVQPICNNGTGSISIVANGGAEPYTYNWSNGETDTVLTNITSGSYTVTVTDAFNCTTSETYTIINPPAITVTSTLSDYGAGVNVTCVNNNGSIDLNISNGTPPYTILWDNSQTDEFIDGLAGGTYSATITDVNGCTTTTTITLIQSDTLIVTLTPSNYNGGFNISCNGATDGTINVSAAAGVAPFTYLWNTGSTEGSLSNLGAGTYTVTVTDVDGCTGQATITLTEPDVLTLTLNVVVTDCNNAGQQITTINGVVNGGATTYNYSWSNGASGTSINPTTSGNYGLTVTDANGCVATADVDVNVDEPLTISVTQLNQLFCNSTDTAQVLLTINSGIAPFNVIWNNGATTNLLTDLGVGSYCVTVTDVNNCSATACTNVTIINNLDVSLTVIEQPGCTSPSGSIQATPNNGTEPYTYVWSSSGQTTDVLSNVTPGTYSVTVTDNNGCTSTASITLTPTIPIIITPEVIDQPTCETAPNGSFTFTVSGGVAPYTISANGNPANSGDTLINLIPGVYTISVIDVDGCEASSIVSLIPNNDITPVIVITNQITCLGGDMGAVDLNVTGGTAPYTYIWSTGSTDEDIAGLTQGQYCVTTTDVNGCTATQCITLTNDFVLASNSSSINITCGAVCNGTATVNPTGGVQPYSVAWSTGATVNSIADLCEGMYYVTITDDSGCIVLDSAEILLPQPYTVQLNTTTTVVGCGAAASATITAVVNGAIPPVTYVWSTGETTSSITVTAGGTYTVTVNDGSFCESINSVPINEIPEIQVDFNISDVQDCFGDSTGSIIITLSNGTPDYTILWSNGSTDNTLNDLAAGTYSLTVSDAAGCTVIESATISQPPPITMTFDVIQTISCAGNEDASVTALPTGQAPYTYLWSNGDTEATADSLGVGTWSVTVTTSNGCVGIDSITLTAPQPLQINATLSAQVDCATGTGGEISLTVIGGTAPFTYQWSPNTADTTNIASGLSAGTYYFTVTDANGCQNNDSLTLIPPTAITLITTPNNIVCGGTATGGITTEVTGGNAPFNYVWSNGSTEANLTNVSAGIYCVTVTEAGGCSATACDTIIDINEALSLSYTFGDTISCNGGCNADVDLSISGGVSPYTIIWSNNATTQNLTDVCAGNYTALVTDANGCTANTQVVIVQPESLIVTLAIVNQPSCGSDNGCITISSVTADPGSYTINWSSSGSNNDTLCGLAPGSYSVTITTISGCTATASISLNQPVGLTVNLNGLSPCFNQCNGGINATVQGGVAPYNFTWSNGQTATGATSLITDLCAGNFTVTVTDVNGCSGTAQLDLTSQAAASVDAGPDQLICGQPNSTVLNGTTNNIASFNWTSIGAATLSANNILNPTATDLASGSNLFILTGTSGINCVYSDTVNVTFVPITANAGPDGSDCEKENLLLQATGQGTWSVIEGNVSLSSNTDPNAIINNIAQGENVLIWTVSQGGCTATDTLVLTLLPISECIDSIKIPTGFSPNGDGVNDNFQILGIELYPNNELTIFNRWGNVVYFKQNYLNEWNGNNLNGEPLPDATYFVIFTSEEKNYKYSGYVDLRRQ